jgi:predicted component of type VI protein secretion system
MDPLDALESDLDIVHSGTFSFPPQDIRSCDAGPSGKDELVVHFMGLQGGTSPLPSYLTEPLLRGDERWSPLRDLYRLLERRLYLLLASRLLARSPMARIEFPKLGGRARKLDLLARVRDEPGRDLRLGGFSDLSPKARGASALRRFLIRHLRIPQARIDDTQPVWLANPSPSMLDGSSQLDGSNALGMSIPVFGERLIVELGPLPRGTYHAWARDPEPIAKRVETLMDVFLPTPMEWEAWAILDADASEASDPVRLGDSGVLLGRTSQLEGAAKPSRFPLARSSPQESDG